MKPVQEAGYDILNGNPQKLYFFCGSEYGIKEEYIDHLASMYGSINEFGSVEDVISMFSHKSFIPVPDSINIVRYDSEFVSKLDKKLASSLNESNIPGTLVCIYQDPKHMKKLDKFFPDSTVDIDTISRDWILRYLSEDNPGMDGGLIAAISANCIDYKHGKVLCSQVSDVDIPYDEMVYVPWILGLSNDSDESRFRIAVAAKNVDRMIDLYEAYDRSKDHLIYCICNVMTDIEKLFHRNSDIDIARFKSRWTLEDIYNCYENSYETLLSIRENPQCSIDDSFYRLASLLRFTSVPSLEEVSSWS